MELVKRFWSIVTTIVSVVTFSPFENGWDYTQMPLRGPSDTALVVTSPVAVATGPVFEPPGTFLSQGFQCDYSAMVGWEPCSTLQDRTCWLKKIDGTEEPFDIFTDYEDRIPTGITRFYTLDVEDGVLDADGLPFTEAKLFNGTYPGPWIEACWGDQIIVNVTNNLAYNGTSVHWHGFRQNQTNPMDGVNGVTQCPIAPGDYFVYNFTASQYGSSWYHSHYSVQYADGTAGGITLHGPSSAAFDEAISPPLIMTDWGHNSAYDAIFNGLANQSILLNGLGNVTRFNNAVPNTTIIQPPFSITLEKANPGHPIKKYLLRLINTSFQTTFLFSIDHHNFTVVEADFVPVFPYTTNSIYVAIGQRYNIIVDAWPQSYTEDGSDIPDDGNYWIRTYIAGNFCYGDSNEGSPGYETTGILRYNPASTADPTTQPWSDITSPIPCPPATYLHDLHPVVPWTIGPASNELSNDTVQGFIDYVPPRPFPLAQWNLGGSPTPLRIDYSNITLLNLDNTGGWPDSWRIREEDFDSTDGETHWVYLLIQSDIGSHPIHLHGHDFAVIQIFDPLVGNATSVNLNNPIRRDVVLLPNKGYIIIAFKADNPGAWLMHCHIAFHIARGLGMQILEDQENAALIWPTRNSPAIADAERVCQNWNIWSDDQANWAPQPNCTETNKEFCFVDDSGV